MIKFFAKGFSHGKGYLCTAVGLPEGYRIDTNAVACELSRRREGIGRSPRMKNEEDKITFLSGIDANGRTDGSPLQFFISNNDTTLPKKPPITALRSGHADLVGCVKYGLDDARIVCELASARRTVAYTAFGAICKQILATKNIYTYSEVTQIGKVKRDGKVDFDALSTAEILSARENGESIGGKVMVGCNGLGMGMGNLIDYENRLDGVIAHALMSIPSVKGVEFGLGTLFSDKTNGQVADVLTVKDGKIVYATNNCGGVVGGLTNGNDIVATLTVKPVPTTKKGVETVDLVTGERSVSHYERSDTCVVSNVGVIAENILAATVLDIVLQYENATVRYEKFNKNCVTGNKVFVVDKKVMPLIDLSGEKVFAIENPEKEKNLLTVEKLLTFFSENKLKRTDWVVAIGGGALSDTAGFSAAIYKRGVNICLVPTTLLSMVDAAHGGKNAVNFDNVKNVIGTFYKPRKVIVDFDFLNTNTQLLKKEAFGEIIKCALLDNKVMSALKADADIKELIKLCISFKNEVVNRDPYDLFWRKQLNLGHTFGHAFERTFSLPHGEAVLQGLFYETMLAGYVGATEKEFCEKTLDFLTRYVTPIRILPTDAERIIDFCMADKKNENENICFVFAAPYFDFELKNVDKRTVKEFFAHVYN